jgi:hypothetical protein
MYFSSGYGYPEDALVQDPPALTTPEEAVTSGLMRFAEYLIYVAKVDLDEKGYQHVLQELVAFSLR